MFLMVWGSNQPIEWRGIMIIQRVSSFVLVLVVLVSAGCAQRTGKPHEGIAQRSLVTSVSREFKPRRVNAVGVLTLENGIGGAALSDTALHDLTSNLATALSANTSLDVINDTNPNLVSRSMTEITSSPISARSKAIKLGRGIGAQAVLYGVISRYVDTAQRGQIAREGTAVGFKLWLIDPSSGVELWSASFDKANAPLSDNLLLMGEAIDSGLRYRTAPELLRFGFVEAARTLEAERKKEPTNPSANP